MRSLAGAVALTTLTGASNVGTLEVSIDHLRNKRGMLHLCLSQNPDVFLDCAADPNAFKLSSPASGVAGLRFDAVPPGRYALSVVHDENGNGMLDTFLVIPREGFGFSRNPKIRLGPPSFNEVRFEIDSGSNQQRVEMNYLL